MTLILKRRLAVRFAVIFFALAAVSPYFASAQSTNYQAQINALLSQIAQLQAALGQSQSQMPSLGLNSSDDYPTGNRQGIGCPALTITMQYGARDTATGGQVTALQRYLAAYFDVSEEGLVSGFFGKNTEKHVIKFQQEHNLPAYGIVGSLTRAQIATICGGSSVPNSTPPFNPSGSVNRATSCTQDGVTVAHGASRTFYPMRTLPAGSDCAVLAHTRTCTNGTLSGDASWQYASCSVAAPTATAIAAPTGLSVSCSTNGAGVQLNWSPVSGITNYLVRLDDTTNNRSTCTDGWLCGAPDMSASNVRIISSSAGGGTYAVVPGHTNRFWVHSTNASGINSAASSVYSFTCNAPATTATNGVCGSANNTTVSGAFLPESNLCSAGTAGSVSGSVGHSWTWSCVGSNGGTTASCAAPTTTATSCTLDNVTLASGASRTFYPMRALPAGGDCAVLAHTRTCTNGTLSGDASWQYASCSVAAPVAAAGTHTVDSATGLEAQCDPSGTYAVLSWPEVVNATYLFRLDNTTNNTASCLDTWKCDSSDIQIDGLSANASGQVVVAGLNYKFWVHTTVGGTHSPARILSFRCNDVRVASTAVPNNSSLANSLTALESAVQSMINWLKR